MIPDEAVEAVAKVFARLTESEWPYEASLGQARLILEAAAPHLIQAAQVEAWDTGHHDGAVDQMLHMENGGAKTTRNPYRKRPDA